MTSLILNLLFGFMPTFILGASIASDSDEDEGRRRRVFLFVYGLWSLTLAMWNWMRSYSPWWIGLWAAAGAVGLVTWVVVGRRVRNAEGRMQNAEKRH